LPLAGFAAGKAGNAHGVIAIGSLLLVVVLSLLINRIATVILVATGMSREAARFQARSALSGAGFTTSESEQVVDHPLRRKVIATLMLLGAAGIVAAASSTILGFQRGGVGNAGYRILELAGGLFLLVWVSRSSFVDRHLTNAISKLLRKYTDIETRDVAGLLQLSGDYSISELAVREGDWVEGRTLGELGLRDEGVVVLGLTRKGVGFIGAPTANTCVRDCDVLLVYGREELLSELDDRPAGPHGDIAHQAAVARQQRIEQRQLAKAG
jgi:hypothetical protein